MASLRSKARPVGSVEWITEERTQIQVFHDQEAEDFTFSARNEVEWLNEHMAEIFNKSQINFTETFKTPGKLRGKTPRTARKRNLLETRAPLTDIFSTANIPCNSPSLNTELFKAAIDPQITEEVWVSPSKPYQTSKKNTDSGYHGTTEDEMDVDGVPTIPGAFPDAQPVSELRESTPLQLPAAPQMAENLQQHDRRSRNTEASYHSAKEDVTGQQLTGEPCPQETVAVNDRDSETVPAILESLATAQAPPFTEAIEPSESQNHGDDAMEDAMDVDRVEHESLLEDHDIDESHTPSYGSSPAKALLRKSSLTFASLPAREPLTTKRSIGARASRTSHLDQGKIGAVSRGSILGRYTEKSLGGSRKPEVDEVSALEDVMNVDEPERPEIVREESDGDAKMSKLHNKSSTQRLHERINMLGQLQAARSTKSIPASVATAQPSYPELPSSTVAVGAAPDHNSAACSESAVIAAMDDDDDDWIKPPTQQQSRPERPQISKSHSADVMEQISGKDSIGGKELGLGPYDRNTTRGESPLHQLGASKGRLRDQDYCDSASKIKFTSPLRSSERIQQKTISASNPAVGAAIDKEHSSRSIAANVNTPISKRHPEGPLSASKSKLQSIMKTARGLFSSSAGVSAQAKLETLSPHSMQTRGQVQSNSIAAMVDANKSAAASQEGRTNLPDASQIRKTRSSTEKEERRKEKEVENRKRIESALQDEQSIAAAVYPEIQTTVGSVSDVRTVEQEVGIHRKHEPAKPTRQSPRRLQIQDTDQQPTKNGVNQNCDIDPVESMGPPPSHSQKSGSQIQKPKEIIRRPVKPAKDVTSKPKPQPVAIRVGTLSQRMPLTNAALSSTLQESLSQPPPRQPSVVKKASNASIQTSISNTSLKNSATSLAPKPKALLAAERKKEQDEKEAQRKLDQKREIERKRAVQQEEVRRQEQQQRHENERQRDRERTASAAMEDPRKVTQKQTIEKRRMELGKKDQQRVPQRPLNDLNHAVQQDKALPALPAHCGELGSVRPASRMHTVQDFSKSAISQPAPNPAKPPTKRVFEPENDVEPARSVRAAAGPPYQQADSKRRRTEDEELEEAKVRPTMAPPIRQSNIRKDGPKPSAIFNNTYNNGPPNTNGYHTGQSYIKTATLNQIYQQQQHQQYQVSRSAQLTDMAKLANGKIPFAEAPNPPPASYKTPLPSKQRPTGPAKSSPHYPNGDSIPLDEIPTDSEDEDSEDEKAKKASMPDWARSAEIRRQLLIQEGLNADEIFGPVPSPHLEEIFKDKNRHHRYRSRTSSANWNGPDRLTEEEIRKDIAARDRMRREGGWTFGL